MKSFLFHSLLEQSRKVILGKFVQLHFYMLMLVGLFVLIDIKLSVSVLFSYLNLHVCIMT